MASETIIWQRISGADSTDLPCGYMAGYEQDDYTLCGEPARFAAMQRDDADLSDWHCLPLCRAHYVEMRRVVSGREAHP